MVKNQVMSQGIRMGQWQFTLHHIYPYSTIKKRALGISEGYNFTNTKFVEILSWGNNIGNSLIIMEVYFYIHKSLGLVLRLSAF